MRTVTKLLESLGEDEYIDITRICNDHGYLNRVRAGEFVGATVKHMPRGSTSRYGDEVSLTGRRYG
jgi:alkylated DNA nucleotide flippase Atl1